MKQLNCPLNGPRNITEFVYGGELHMMPDAHYSSSREWAEYVFFDDNAAANVIEWWCHGPTSYWFLAERNTVTDEVIRTFAPTELFNQRIEFAGPQS